MSGPVTASGFKIKIGQYHFRIWKNGMEFGNKLGGRFYIFPWGKK
jgi:hypothetical protein